MKFLVRVPLALIDGVLPGASRMAPEVDAVFLALLLTCGAVALGVGLCVVWFLVRYRRGSNAPRPIPRWPESVWETTWIVGTTAIFMVFYWIGARVYLRMEQPPPDAMTIDVVGRQWMWDVRHGNGRREFNAVHVPVNQPVMLRLSSEDVIHSFAVPAFRVKQDVVPGKTTTTWFEATRPGRFPIYCDQYCGTAHSEMNGEVVVESAADFARWSAEAGHREPAPGEERGARLYVQYGCAGCHDTESRKAPALAGLFGREIKLAGGQRLRVDESYLRESILQPAAKLAAGYEATMPVYATALSAADVDDLVAYLRRLPAPTDQLALSP